MTKDRATILSRKIPAPLTIVYEPLKKEREETLKREYYSLSQSDDDAIGQWLRVAKAKGDTRDSDTVLLHLVVELHRKVDELTKIVKNETKEYIELEERSDIELIGHGFFQTKLDIFEPNRSYYGRVDLPVFPSRVVPIFFKGLEPNIGKIELMHDRDSKDWDGYITSRERAIIRESRKKSGEF